MNLGWRPFVKPEFRPPMCEEEFRLRRGFAATTELLRSENPKNLSKN